MTRPKEPGALTNSQRQRRFRARRNTLTPLQRVRQDLYDQDPTLVDKGDLYSPEEAALVADLRDRMADIQTLARRINQSLVDRLMAARSTTETRALLVALMGHTTKISISTY